MAKRTKHTHKYILKQLSKFNRGWRCAIEHCDHFLPRNVEDTIDGRMSICWECDEIFRLDEWAIKEDMPRCIDCREGRIPNENDVDLEEFQQILAMKTKYGVQSLGELDPNVVKNAQMLNLLPKHIPLKYLEVQSEFPSHVPADVKPDHIEITEEDGSVHEVHEIVHSEHRADCEVYFGGECTCK